LNRYEVAKWLEEFDCDYDQHSLYDKPLAINDFEKKYIKRAKSSISL